MKTKVKSEYEIQAENFLNEAGITFKALFLFHGPHWEDDKENRNVWELILTREKKTFSVRFGQSIAESFLWLAKDGHRLVEPGAWGARKYEPTKRNLPTSYDFLACLTKYDPGTFEDFCGEFGYDTDSRKAEKTYFAVQEEWKKVRTFFSADEIEKLQEIN